MQYSQKNKTEELLKCLINQIVFFPMLSFRLVNATTLVEKHFSQPISYVLLFTYWNPPERNAFTSFSKDNT